MQRRRLLHAALVAAVAWLCAGALHAQIGDRPIRIIFPFAAGGSGDTLSRLVADKMRVSLNHTVIVEDRAGADGRIGVNDVRTSEPDGTTLLLTPIAPMAIYQHVYSNLGYDPIKDFTPLSELGTFDFGVAVGSQMPIKTVKELVAWAKANPSLANYGIPGAGTLPQFLGVMLGRTAGIDLRAVPYHGSAAAVTDVVAGHIPLIITTTADLVQMHKAGRVRVLATSDKQRSPFLPDVPTLRESGYDLVATGWYGMFAPAKTPPDVVERLNKAIIDAVHAPDIKERMEAFGLQPTGTTAAEFAVIQKADAEKWGPPVKASGFKPED